MNLAIWLERTAVRHPNRQAIFLGSECLATYREFWLAVCALRSHLENEGIKPGDRVAVYMRNCPEYLIAFYAIWSMGAVILPINSKLHTKEVGWILANAGSSYVLCDESSISEINFPGVTVFNPKWQQFDSNIHIPPVKRSSTDLAWYFILLVLPVDPKAL